MNHSTGGRKMFRRYTTALMLVASLVFSSVAALAQAPQEKIDLDTLAKIKDEGMKHSQVMETLSYLTDVYGPRLTASPDIKAAQDWAKQRLEGWGLQNA